MQKISKAVVVQIHQGDGKVIKTVATSLSQAMKCLGHEEGIDSKAYSKAYKFMRYHNCNFAICKTADGKTATVTKCNVNQKV